MLICRLIPPAERARLVRYGMHIETPVIAVDPAELAAFSWERLFPGRGALPVELEIGTGKAAFLLRRARELPDRNFLGIEWANEFYRFAVYRFERWKLRNVRMLRTDAGVFMRVTCPRESLAVLHVYHPDPWPKKRHHKRRLFQPPLVDAAVACLIPGGRWCVQTDHAEYFAALAPLLRAHPLLEEVPFNDPAFGVTDERIATNFEIKYLKEGRAIFQIAMRKKPTV